jgi:hypothetical protein
MAGLLATLLSAFGATEAPTADEWTVSTGQAAGKPVIARFRSAAPPNAAAYPTLIVISWSYPEDSSGLPDSDVRERMDRLEDLLTERVEADGVAIHTATETGRGLREWQWYARSEEEMMQAVNGALRTEAPFPIEFASEHDPQWRAYTSVAAEPQ